MRAIGNVKWVTIAGLVLCVGGCSSGSKTANASKDYIASYTKGEYADAYRESAKAAMDSENSDRDRAALIRALSILPEYLKNKATESGAVIDYRDWQVPLGRRFRALKLWFVIRSFGIAGLRQKIREHVALAQELASWVDADPRFERMAPLLGAPPDSVCLSRALRTRRGNSAAW